MSQSIPLVVYNINNKPLGKTFVSTNYTYTLYSYMKFPIKVLSGQCMIYSAVVTLPGRAKTLTIPIVEKGLSFTGNAMNQAYTIFMKSDCVLQIGDDIYTCKLELDNKFTEEQDDNKEWVNSHYNYLITNYNLPTWEELYPAWFGDDKREIIKRMLLDFRRILRMKGTIESVRLFFKLIQLSNIDVFEEYAYIAKSGLIEKTIKPDKLTDWKTADYWVIFENWIEREGNDGLDSKNMPIRTLQYTDMKDFFSRLMYAIIVADKYFTLPEQDIAFFGMVNSANSHQFPGVTSNVSQVFYDDTCHFRKHIDIDLINYHNSYDMSYLVENNLQKKIDTYMSEVKIIAKEGYTDLDNVFFAEKEYYDDGDEDVPEDKLEHYMTLFANVLHLNITSPNTYVRVYIQHSLDESMSITFDKAYVEKDLQLLITTRVFGLFNVLVEVWDTFNNRERYTYQYEIKADSNRVDFDAYNSGYVDENPINDIFTGVSSPAHYPVDFNDFMNYVLFQQDVPDDLSHYYDADHEKLDMSRHYMTNPRYVLEDLNQNFSVEDVTDTIPLDLIESWIEIYALKYDPSKRLMLKVYDGELCETILIDYNKIRQHVSELTDKLYVCMMDVYESEEHFAADIISPYIFISTTELGIDIKSLYEFCLCSGQVGYQDYYRESDFDSVESIFDGNNYLHKKLPVNHDFEIFILKSQSHEQYPEFINQLSGVDISGKVNIRALFPRIVKMSEAGKYTTKSVYDLQLGDVIYCSANHNYITGETDNVWEVRNAFDDSLVFTTNDENLKYRIEDMMIYTIVFKFMIGGQQYEIRKESLISSFPTDLTK